jgi:flagellar M-ring protein FliF
MSAGQVRGIMNLVAHSTSGLSAKAVSVVDQQGLVLSAGVLSNATSVSGTSTAQLAAENSVASQIRTNVGNMLSQVLGPGNAVVQVSAILNFNHSTVHSTQYGKGVLAQQQVQTSSSSGTVPPSTPVGTTGNTPGVTTVSSTSGTNTSTSKTTINKYDVNSSQTVQTVPAGQIQRLTVAVVVNKKITAAEAKSLKSLVANAAGVNFKNGDQLSVVGMPFNRTAVNQALVSMQKAQRSQTLRQGIVALLALGALIFLFLMIRRTFKNRPRATDVPVSMTLPTAVGAPVFFVFFKKKNGAPTTVGVM